MKIQGPVEIEIKVNITNGEGIAGVATIGMGVGKYPTEKEMRDRVAKFEQDEMPEGFRLMTKREWWETVCPPTYEEDVDGERIPVHFAIPGGNEYED